MSNRNKISNLNQRRSSLNRSTSFSQGQEQRGKRNQVQIGLQTEVKRTSNPSLKKGTSNQSGQNSNNPEISKYITPDKLFKENSFSNQIKNNNEAQKHKFQRKNISLQQSDGQFSMIQSLKIFRLSQSQIIESDDSIDIQSQGFNGRRQRNSYSQSIRSDLSVSYVENIYQRKKNYSRPKFISNEISSIIDSDEIQNLEKDHMLEQQKYKWIELGSIIKQEIRTFQAKQSKQSLVLSTFQSQLQAIDQRIKNMAIRLNNLLNND